MSKIALVGNPNSGKTTLFNALTGSSQRIGNWPGVTVEKKEGKIKNRKNWSVVELPGIYSLSPYSLEEIISRDYIINEKPEAIINVVDGSNLERNLYLTTQLIETGIPVIIALNMMDIVEKNEDVINTGILEKMLNSQVVKIVAIEGEGIKELIEALDCIHKKTFEFMTPIWFSKEIEEVLSEIQNDIKDYFDKNRIRWYAIKLFERDEKVLDSLLIGHEAMRRINQVIKIFEENNPMDTETQITMQRYDRISKIYSKVYQKNKIRHEKISDRIDRIVTNKYLALPIFGILIFIVYYLSISTIGGIMTDYVNDVLFGDGGIPDIVGGWMNSISMWDWLENLIVDGIIGGVGAVLGFLPQMLVLFILLGLLEESGYMSRVAFILDRMFRRFGLSGKSFIPMLISTGCAIPGIMSARTIEEENNRKLTIITTSFMPCGAKLPIIALIAGALFSNSSWQWVVAPSAYFIGIGAVVISGIILKKFKLFAGEAAPFIMELPDYKLPRLRSLSFQVWNKIKSFIKKAGTVILVASIGVWFLSSFDLSFHMTDDVETSILASIGKIIYILFTPLGWGDWKAAVATFTGLIAKENVVSTFGILYGFSEVGETGQEIWGLIGQDFSMLSAYSFLIFNLICAPCFAAIGAIRREMGNKKWTLFAVAFQTIFAYVLAFIVYQIGSIFVNGFTFAGFLGVGMFVILLYLLFRKNKYISA